MSDPRDRLASASWIKRGRPMKRCRYCAHRERDYRLVRGACANVAACEDRIRMARSVNIRPPVDRDEIFASGLQIVCARFHLDGALYEYERVS